MCQRNNAARAPTVPGPTVSERRVGEAVDRVAFSTPSPSHILRGGPVGVGDREGDTATYAWRARTFAGMRQETPTEASRREWASSFY
jgi:hypothetical protein